ncbi:F0F1 ATP synthase subunit epsilon [Alsobacter soli]|uniref:ATP synthase epsilon chain n=1 Tax=Alsobacter soli TaxID=2109933 RepID=A0A2T1HW16_9HYPH|nr:F0F1 ATP synthase subunit epsilon [Alsobacter soli]PSC05867.1 F0F1 ATP synthase subunit epsilon [Alsobacter soli]
MATFPFELVSPERLLISAEVEQVVVPGTEGDFGVLKDHAPLMSTLRPGVVVVTGPQNNTQRLFVRGGFAEVSPRGLTILAEQAIPVEEVTDDVIAAEIKAAEADFEKAGTEESRRAAADRLAQLVTLRETLMHPAAH